MDWMEQWIEEILAEVPNSRYRQRTAAELLDHMETAYRAQLESGRPQDEARAGVLSAMGEPGKLRAAYKTAWERSLSGRLRRLSDVADAWLDSLIIMTVTHWAIIFAGFVLLILLVNTIELLPAEAIIVLMFATGFLFICGPVTVGAVYLRREFQASARAVWQVSVPLIIHGALVILPDIFQSVLIGGGQTFMDGVRACFRSNYWIYLLRFAACIIMGQIFGRLPVKKRETETAA